MESIAPRVFRMSWSGGMDCERCRAGLPITRLASEVLDPKAPPLAPLSGCCPRTSSELRECSEELRGSCAPEASLLRLAPPSRPQPSVELSESLEALRGRGAPTRWEGPSKGLPDGFSRGLAGDPLALSTPTRPNREGKDGLRVSTMSEGGGERVGVNGE